MTMTRLGVALTIVRIARTQFSIADAFAIANFSVFSFHLLVALLVQILFDVCGQRVAIVSVV